MGGDINAKNQYNMTPAHKAARNQNIEVIKLIISNGGDINTRNNLGMTPAHCATENEN